MIEEIEQERQTVGGVDVLEHADIAGRRTDLVAEIEDEGIVIFEYGGPVQRDQTLLRLDAGQLIVGGQREIAGDRADHQQIVFREKNLRNKWLFLSSYVVPGLCQRCSCQTIATPSLSIFESELGDS